MAKEELKKKYDILAQERDYWKRKNSYYYEELTGLIKSIVEPDRRVLEAGCGTGEIIAALNPSYGVGIDISPKMLDIARKKFPHIKFIEMDVEELKINEVFDYVIMSDLMGDLEDIYKALKNIRNIMDENSRLIITYYNFLWEPLIKLAEFLKLKMPQGIQNWLSRNDIKNLLYITGFDCIYSGTKFLIPKKIPVISYIFNKFFSELPFFRHFALIHYVVARKIEIRKLRDYSVSVIVPCRNERENIMETVERLPVLGSDFEVIFVDGYSTDGTVEKIIEAQDRFKEKNVKLIHQIPRDAGDTTPPDKMLKAGKKDAVYKGFDAAKGEILIVLDSDLTIAPEDIEKVYEIMSSGIAEFVNGVRFVYPLKQSMRFLNMLGNKFFSIMFSWILGIEVKDTLCGLKAVFRKDYERIKNMRHIFRDFDPYSDFELLFGACKLKLKIVDLPLRYYPRKYGAIKIMRFKHGVMLLRALYYGFKILKFM